jgi:hypothetical protein
VPGERDGGPGGARQCTVAGGTEVDLEVDRGGQVPGQAAGEHVLGPQADVLELGGVGVRPAPEAGEDVGQVEAAAFAW